MIRQFEAGVVASVPLRLVGIDTPKTGQPGGDAATVYAAAFCEGCHVTIEHDGTDAYGRILTVPLRAISLVQAVSAATDAG